MIPEYFLAAVAILPFLAAAVDFIPVANVVTDLVSVAIGNEGPTWWAFALKFAETVTVLQFLMPIFENITIKTANTWDDGLFARAKMILAFALELMAAVGAFDPQLGRRIKAITGPRRTLG